MKTMRSNGLIMLISVMLLGLAMAIAACGQTSQLGASEPNANLSNEELVSTAITNMMALKSYRFDFIGTEPTSPGYSWNVTGYSQAPGTISLTTEYTAGRDFPRTIVGFGAGLEKPTSFLIVGGQTYKSQDEGNTWRAMSHQDLDVAALIPIYPAWMWNDISGFPVREELANMKYVDGDTRTESVGGVPAHHIVTDVQANLHNSVLANTLLSGEMKTMTLNLWLSTDATPTVRRMRVDATGPAMRGTGIEPGAMDNVSCSLTWTWSRFNEDFGEVKPPPAETIKGP